jgi:hypothetical protein
VPNAATLFTLKELDAAARAEASGRDSTIEITRRRRRSRTDLAMLGRGEKRAFFIEKTSITLKRRSSATAAGR